MKKLKILLIYLILAFNHLHSRELITTKKYNLAICTIIENRSKFLIEWIEYHRLAGVDHFYLYDLTERNQNEKILKPYIKMGLVSLIKWRDLSKNTHDDGMAAFSTRIPAYENAVRFKALYETAWLVFLDDDEFLVPPVNCDLMDILKKFSDYPAIVLSSETYNAADSNSKKLVIESLELSSAPKQVLERSLVKTIFKPELVSWFTWPPYQFVFKNGLVPITLRKCDLRINHYLNRSSGYIYTRNTPTKVEVDPSFFTENELRELFLAGYQIEDKQRAIYKFVPALRQRMNLDSSRSGLTPLP